MNDNLVTFKITGLEQLQAQLLDLGPQLGLKTLAAAARKAFAPVLEGAKSLVPIKSGALRDAIRLTVKKPKGGDMVVVVGLRISSSVKSAGKELPPSRRWHFVELGTSKLAAHPYLRPALDANADEVLELLKDELVIAIDKALTKRAKG